jgi:hypothetical protein
MGGRVVGQKPGGGVAGKRHQHVVVQSGDELARCVVDDGAAHGEGLLQRRVNGLIGDGIDGFLRTVQCAHDCLAPCWSLRSENSDAWQR